MSSDALWSVWVVLGCLVAAAEIAGRLNVAGASTLANVLKRTRASGVGRAVMVLIWGWLGWHLFAR